jgi:hypothetical protein
MQVLLGSQWDKLMHSDQKESISTCCTMAKHIRIKRYSKRSGCNWFNIYRNISSANRTTRTVFYWTSTCPCNTYPISYWQSWLYLLCQSAILGHQNSVKQFTMMQQICANGPLHFPEDCVILAEYLPKSTPNNCAIYNTTNKPKTRTPVRSTCRRRCRP